MTFPKKFLSLLLLLFVAARLFAQDSLVIGEFVVTKVTDGDTFKFDKLDKSVRLLGIDTEETFKGIDAELKKNELAKDWFNYYSREKLKSLRPAKIESPYGYDTWQWTKELFKDVVKVRLELEETSRAIDFFGRYLAYVIAIKADGTEFNYNVECVKQGYSPYFPKYGYSKRFHQQFVDAQNYALENKLGIWSGNELCYPDYPERIEWWNRRAEALKTFDEKYKGRKGYFSVLDDKDFAELKNHLNEEVIIFGSLSEILEKKEPYLLRFDHNAKEHIDGVVFSEYFYVLDELNIEKLAGEYIYFKGTLSEYKGRPQIKLTSSKQIWIE